MRRALSLLPLLAVACTTEAGPSAASEADAALLATMLEGRTAGQPMSCVRLVDIDSNRSAGESAILFDGPGDTIYVNRPPAGCPSVNDRTLVSRTSTTQLCRGDIVNIVDVASGTQYGSCGLGDFVPYRRN